MKWIHSTMGKRRFELHVEANEEDAVRDMHKAFGEAGYRSIITVDGTIIFVRGTSFGSGGIEKGHKVHVSTLPSDKGTRFSIVIETELGAPVIQQDQAEEYIRNLLSFSLPVANPLYRGKVSQDGMSVKFYEDTGGLTVGPLENPLPEHGRSVKVFLVIIAIFFYVVSFALIFDMVFDLTGTARGQLIPVFLVLLLLLGSSGPIGLIYYDRTKKFPTRVLPNFDGVHLYYPKKPALFVPWNRCEGIGRSASRVLVSFKWRDEGGRARFAYLTDSVAEMVHDAHEAVTTILGDVSKSSSFMAFNVVSPNSEVMVSRRPLNDEEIRYKKLARRWLSKGPPIPVYITKEEDARLVKEYVDGANLDKDGLKEVASQASIEEMWVLGAELYEMLVKEHPDEEEFSYNLAGCLMESDRVQDGLMVVDRYLERHPDSSRCHAMKAMLCMKIERVEEALHHVGRAVETNPNNLEALNIWFDIVSGESGIGQAIAEIDYLTTQYPKAWGPHLVMGYRNLATRQTDDALEHMREAVGIESNDDTLYALSGTLLELHRVDEAVQLLEAYRIDHELPPGLIMNLAFGYFERGQGREALEILERIDMSKGGQWVAAANELRRRILPAR